MTKRSGITKKRKNNRGLSYSNLHTGYGMLNQINENNKTKLERKLSDDIT